MTTTLRKMPGIPAFVVSVDGAKAGVIRQRPEGWTGVAGSVRLGPFPTKQAARDAVAAERSPA